MNSKIFWGLVIVILSLLQFIPEEIQKYVFKKFGFKVSTLYIAQTKRKCGIEVKEHYNKSKKENQRVPQCTPEKEDAIMDALRHFKMI